MTEYKREVLREIRTLDKNDILQCVDTDIKNQISLTGREESHELIADILAEFSYEPFSHKKEKERNLGRIMQMFATIVEKYFRNELGKRKSRTRTCITKLHNK